MATIYSKMVGELLAGKVLTIPACEVAGFNPATLRSNMSREKKACAAAGFHISSGRRLRIQAAKDGSLVIEFSEPETPFSFSTSENPNE